MDKITLVKQEITAAEWGERIRDCRNSGVMVTEWCNQNGINPKSITTTCEECGRIARSKLCVKVANTVPQEPVARRNRATEPLG